MPRYLSISSLPPSLIRYIRPLTAPVPLTRPSPTEHLLSLPPTTLPLNLRVQEWVDDRKHWTGVGTVERLGGRKTKDHGKVGRLGKGREARKLGGLKWALRER